MKDLKGTIMKGVLAAEHQRKTSKRKIKSTLDNTLIL
jgi:hypothetical protein